MDRLDGLVDARALLLREAEVVVRAEVQQARALAGEAEGPVVVVRRALEEVKVRAGQAANGAVPRVADAAVPISRDKPQVGAW